MTSKPLKLLFIINPGAGNSKTNWKTEIENYFKGKPANIDLFELPDQCDPRQVEQKIKETNADRVVAVGGDGTLKLVAGILKGSNVPIGLLPAGSANGMAKELGIPLEPVAALDIIMADYSKNIHMVKVNDELCIHLSDIGFNAFVVKKFEDNGVRGMWGYVKAAWKVLWYHYRMRVDIRLKDQSAGGEYLHRDAAMIVIANATKYGTGVLINPEGRLDDDLFEVVIVKKISFSEIFKMRFTHRPYHPEKTELLSTSSLTIKSRHHVHFQVDGEYLGKAKNIKAEILPDALKIIMPDPALHR